MKEKQEHTLPAHWASYLINGDASGLKKGEQEKIDAFLARHDLPFPVSCSDETRFSWRNDANICLGGDVLDFTFLVPRKASDGGDPAIQRLNAETRYLAALPEEQRLHALRMLRASGPPKLRFFGVGCPGSNAKNLIQIPFTEARPEESWYRRPSWPPGLCKRFRHCHTMSQTIDEFLFFKESIQPASL